jgi:sodium-dependent dicarboxylate transporter 2/3/5
MRLPVAPGALVAAGAFLALRLAPAPAGLGADGWAVAAIGLAIAILWLSEAIPIAVSATLPFLLLPLLTDAETATVARSYWSPVLFLVLGGAMAARAVEKSGLHARVALAIAARAPGTAVGILLAFMAATALISMAVSNTSTALMMMPVALALAAAVSRPEDDRLTKAVILGVAWAATIGGLGTLIGSPTNAIAAGIMNAALGTGIDFLTWAAFGLPLVLLAVPMAAAILAGTYRLKGLTVDHAALTSALPDPGPLSAPERRLIPFLLLLVGGWVVLPLLSGPLGLPRLEDGTVAMAVAFLLFLAPDGRGGTLLDRGDLKALPWDVLLLFGGGLALADAMTDTGLAGFLGSLVGADVAGLHPLLLVAILVALVILVTEFASNVATASGFMPVVAALVSAGGAAPLMLAMPTALASSWGFMMPAGTPPNAIAFGTGRLKVRDMAKPGLVLNLAGVPLIVLLSWAMSRLLGG